MQKNRTYFLIAVFSILPFAESLAQSDTLFVNKYTGLEWYLVKDIQSLTLSHHADSLSASIPDTLFINLYTSTIIHPLSEIRDISTTHSDLFVGVQWTAIAAAISDANNDYRPDSLGKTVTVIGIVNSTNLQGAANFQYTIQDDNAGVMIYKSGAGGPSLKIGNRVLVTGTISQYRGTTEITPALFSDVKVLDTNNVLSPVPVSISQFLSNGEAYESRRISIHGLARTASTVAWPATGADANFVMTDGWDSVVVHLDKNTSIPGIAEPAYPVEIQGIATQFTSAATVYNDGYQITPISAGDITGSVQVAPNPHFRLVTSAQGSAIELDSTSQAIAFCWNKAYDMNGDKLTYQWMPIGFSAVPSGNAGADTFLVRTGAQLRALMSGKDSVTLKWTVKVKDPINPSVNNSDTVSIILRKGKITGVLAMEQLPTSYLLYQNFPNPFNPSTMIRFALPYNAKVTLTIYDVIGRQVAELVNQELAAGYHQYLFDANNLAGGVYFYRIAAAEVTDKGGAQFNDVKKLILLK